MSTTDSSLSRLSYWVLGYAVFWVVIILLFAGQISLVLGQPIEIGLVGSATLWAPWMLVSPLMLLMGYWLPPGRLQWWKFSLLHLAACSLLILLAVLITPVLPPPPGQGPNERQRGPTNTAMDDQGFPPFLRPPPSDFEQPAPRDPNDPPPRNRLPRPRPEFISLLVLAMVPSCLLAQDIPVEPPPPTPNPTPVPVQITLPPPLPSIPITTPNTAPANPPPPVPLPTLPPPPPAPISEPIPASTVVTRSPEPAVRLYSEGNFRQTGTFYHPQQLGGLGGGTVHNAWLVGQFRIMGYEDEHHLILQTGAVPRSMGQPGIDLLGTIVHQAVASHLVTVHVFIAEPGQPINPGTLVQYNRSYPLKIVGVETDGNLSK